MVGVLTSRVAALDCEERPAEDFPPVVGAGDPLKAPALGDAPLLSAWLAQVAQSDVCHQVEVLEEHEQDDHTVHELLAAGPGWGPVLGVQEEVHVDEAEDEPVVEAVLEEVEGGHRVVGEAVHEEGLELSLEVVRKDESHGYLLIHGQRLVRLVDLLPEGKQQADHDQGTCILKHEYLEEGGRLEGEEGTLTVFQEI